MAINFRQMFQNQSVMVIGGIAIIVAITVFAMLTGGSSNAPTSHKEPNWIMWVVLAILPLLALQIYGKGGAVVTAMIGVLALIAVVLLGNNISRSYTYGDKAAEVLQHQREVATKKALAEVTSPQAEPTRELSPQERVVFHDLVIVQGKAEVEKRLACYIDSIKKADKRKLGITRTEEGNMVKYNAPENAKIPIRIWFFDEGGQSCEEDKEKLLKAQAFL